MKFPSSLSRLLAPMSDNSIRRLNPIREAANLIIDCRSNFACSNDALWQFLNDAVVYLEAQADVQDREAFYEDYRAWDGKEHLA